MQKGLIVQKDLNKYEARKRKWTLFIARLLNKKISKSDIRTIQEHKNADGTINYYIKNPQIQWQCGYPSFSNVSLVKRYQDGDKRFVYRGVVCGANNAFGILESNVPLSEIVASVSGNIQLQKILSEEFASSARNNYYQSIGESLQPLENHIFHFAKPEFPLGSIQKVGRNRFTIVPQVSEDIYEMIENERNKMERTKQMRNPSAVEKDAGSFVVARADCWLNQGTKKRNLSFAGINEDAHNYEFLPEGKAIKTQDNKYVQIGELQIGKPTVQTENGNSTIIGPNVYENIVLWTDNENLIQYFLSHKLDGLNFVLGDIFSIGNVEKSAKHGEHTYVGGISINKDGECEKVDKLPNTVRQIVEQQGKNRTNQGIEIVR